MIGKKFNRLTIVGFSHKDRYYTKHWECLCDCGNTTVVSIQKLKSGHTRSCGCLQKERPGNYKDGRSKEPLYKVYYGILDRCHNEKCSTYYKYGAKGIHVCDEWKNSYETFRDWALSSGYATGLSIDRINAYKGYSPDNCRWADRSTQQTNKRVWSTTPYVSYSKSKNKWVGRITHLGKRVEILVDRDLDTVMNAVIAYVLANNMIEQEKVLRNAGLIK